MEACCAANGTSERQRCCCLHSSTTSSCAKNNGYSCFRSVPDALAVNSDGRYLTTRGVDRHVHKVQFVSAFMIMKVDKAEKLDGGEGGKRGESLVARTLGV
ncbi:hypothetical protein YC2023_031516 [Brassica napus]